MRLALLCGVAAAAALVLGFVRFVDTIDGAERRPEGRVDGIVALTGGADRVSDAVGLLRDGHAGRLLVTGVNATTTREEFARQHPRARPLVDCCIDLGYEALNTIGNARETADWVRAHGVRSLIVVTSNYHMPRALAELGAVLPETDLRPYPVVSDRMQTKGWWADAQIARTVVSEYLKYLVARGRLALTSAPSRRQSLLDVDLALIG